MDNLFLRFTIIYKGLWTQNIKSDVDALANQIEWYLSLQYFNAEIVSRAIEICKTTYDQPPSIKQFVELCRQERDRYNFHTPKLTDERQAPVSPLLREYMLRNPRQSNDPFKSIFDRCKGKERGIETLKEVKRQLAGKLCVKV